MSTSHTSKELIAGSTTVENRLTVQTIPYLYDVAKGNIAGSKPFAKLGFNGDVDNVEEDLWPQGGKYVFPAAATAMEAVSSSGNDAALGTGIQQIRVAYLDNTFAEQSEIITLNGVGAVAMVGRPFRVNAIRAYRVGANKVAAGTILLRGSGGGATYRAISTGQTRGRSMIYTVPLGKRLYLSSVNLSVVNAAALHYAIFTLRANYDDVLDQRVEFMEPYFEIGQQEQGQHYELESPIKIPATCDLVMSVIGDAANANDVCTAGVRGWIETI